MRASSLRTAGTGPIPMKRGSTPATALPTKYAEGLEAEALHLVLRGDHNSGGAVADARGVARCDAAAFAESRLERRQLVQRRVRSRVLVGDGPVDRYELVL